MMAVGPSPLHIFALSGTVFLTEKAVAPEQTGVREDHHSQGSCQQRRSKLWCRVLLRQTSVLAERHVLVLGHFQGSKEET